MSCDLRGRSLLELLDFTPDEIRYLLQLSAELKAAKCEGSEEQRLAGKNIALIFEKTSTRTRVAFEVAAYDQGAHVTYLEPSGCQIGHKESMKDTARVLGRVYDGIEYRGFAQKTVETLAEYAGVPVWNGLTDGPIRPRCWPTCSPCPSIPARRWARSRTATWETRTTTWPTRSWSAAASWGWTSACAARRLFGPIRTSSRPVAASPPRPARG